MPQVLTALRSIGRLVYQLLHPGNDLDSWRIPIRDQQAYPLPCLPVHREVRVILHINGTHTIPEEAFIILTLL